MLLHTVISGPVVLSNEMCHAGIPWIANILGKGSRKLRKYHFSSKLFSLSISSCATICRLGSSSNVRSGIENRLRIGYVPDKSPTRGWGDDRPASRSVCDLARAASGGGVVVAHWFYGIWRSTTARDATRRSSVVYDLPSRRQPNFMLGTHCIHQFRQETCCVPGVGNGWSSHQ
jgi:hypothetical protein